MSAASRAICDPKVLRMLARRCRMHAQSSTEHATVDMLRCWAVELADAADEAEWNAHDPGDPKTARRCFRVEDPRR